MEAALVHNARIRDEDTRNLVRAAKAAGVKKKSSRKALRLCMRPMRHSLLPKMRRCWILPSRLTAKPPARCTAWSSKSPPTLRYIGVVLRYGWLYGAGTGFDAPVDFAPPVHAEAAAHAAVLALQCTQSAIYNAADDNARLSSEKAKRELGFDAGFRL